MTIEKKTSHHPEFKELEKKRPDFDSEKRFVVSKSPNTNWKLGDGAHDDEWKKYKKMSVSAYSDTRPPINNYKLLVSAITPRPIGLISTLSKDGKRNLAPFSFFNVANVEPPAFLISITASKGIKGTLANILETGQLTVNIISEWFLEAANFASIDAPSHIDEWELSGLTPAKSEDVQPPHVAESAFSAEAKLVHHHEWKSKVDQKKPSGFTVLVEANGFHIREDLTNEDFSSVDLAKLKPVSRLGGISYGRTTDTCEVIRPEFAKHVPKSD